MKNGYFELGYLLLIVGFGTFDWIERSRERMEAVATATHLRAFLTERLGTEPKPIVQSVMFFASAARACAS